MEKRWKMLSWINHIGCEICIEPRSETNKMLFELLCDKILAKRQISNLINFGQPIKRIDKIEALQLHWKAYMIKRYKNETYYINLIDLNYV